MGREAGRCSVVMYAAPWTRQLRWHKLQTFLCACNHLRNIEAVIAAMLDVWQFVSFAAPYYQFQCCNIENNRCWQS